MTQRQVCIDKDVKARVRSLLSRLSDCDLCPRQCRVDRTAGERGICEQTDQIRISSANLHFGEEPPISGNRGSGTIFLSGCNLKCSYCQNYPISQMGHGKNISPLGLVDRMLELENRGAHNINFVTPTHYSARIAEAIMTARKRGLKVPIVWNSSGYDSVDVLECLEGMVEVYMPDMRYGESEPARCYSNAPDYPEVNREAISEMYRQVGTLEVDSNGIARRGLLIRHLVLPNKLSATDKIFEFIAEEISTETHISLMSQYFPAYRAHEFEMISRRITKKEYLIAKRLMEKYNLTNGWIQNEML
ncbi:MAG: radical SAM protein [candidate division Zixibacteria bacterium]|nr:radical SAM protein [candidate division Zixibacteria bacterium]